MKKLSILTVLILSCIAFFAFKPAKRHFSDIDASLFKYLPRDTFPNLSKVGSDSAKYIIRGMPVGGQGLQFTPYQDTASANLSPVHSYVGAAISVKGELYVRDSTKTKWVKFNAGGGSNISIYQDSILVICNLNSCDSFVTHITINNWRIEGDTAIIVCNDSGSCDTININPTPFNTTYVDSVKVKNSIDSIAVDTIYYYIQGNAYIGGYIIGRKDTVFAQKPLYVYNDSLGHQVIAIQAPDGLITPGYVTWLHDSTFYVTSATYIINGVYYTSPGDSITLSGIDPTDPVKFLFIVDTTGHATYLRGTPAPIPLDPQVDPASQIALTTGITFNAGATNPANITLISIYDENLGTPSEWAASHTGTMTVDYNSTANPFHLSKAAFVSSYTNGSKLTFLSASVDTVTNGEVLFYAIYLNGALGTKSFRIQFFNGSTASSSNLSLVNTFGLNPNDSNKYQIISIPLSAFTWSSQLFNKLVITHVGTDNSGAKGYYKDYINLQIGIPNIPPPTDYSNKVDSTTTLKINDSTYVGLYWVKGISYQKGDTIKIHSSGGSGTTERFGIEDSTGIQNRYMALGSFNFDMLSGTADYSAKVSELLMNNDFSYLYSQSNTGDLSQYAQVLVRGDDAYGAEMQAGNSGGVTSLQASTDNVKLSYDNKATFQRFPHITGNYYIPLTVNGNAADASGNIIISTGGTGGISKLGSPTYGLIRVNDSTYKADSATLSLYYLRLKDSTAGGYYPYSSNPKNYLTSIDTTNISNFSVKVRSLFSATSPITYNSATGKIAFDTNVVHTSAYNDGRYLQNITGLVTQGTNVTITGSGTSGSPYVVNSSGGGGSGQIFNIGSGFRWVKPTDTVKTAFANVPLSIDSSSNTNGLTIKADTTVSNPIALVTQNQLGKKPDTSILQKFLFTNPTNYSFLRIDSVNNRVINSHLKVSSPLQYNEANDSLSFGTSGSWLITGNSGTTASANFVGTTDDIDLEFRRHNVFSGVIDSANTTLGYTTFGFGAGKTQPLTNITASVTAFGYKALASINSVSAEETAFGDRALFSEVSGIRNAAFGANAGSSMTSNDNSVFGDQVAKTVTGSGITAMGSGAMASVTGTGASNTAIGWGSLQWGSGSSNTALGVGSLQGNSGSLPTGSFNTGVGISSGLGLSLTAANNIFLGYFSGKYTSSASNQLIINSLDRTNYLGDTTKSIIYGRQNATVEAQVLTINGRVGVNHVFIDSNAVMDIQDTTGGILIPRLTTTRRTGISSRIDWGSTTAAGTGYTPGTYNNVALTGGSGTGALATVVVNGSGFAQIANTLTFGGYNYVNGDVLGIPTSIVGAGSGFTWTVSGIMHTQIGMQVIDTTLKKQFMYDGTIWTEGAKVLSASATLDFPSTSAGTASDLTVTCTGAADGDVVSIGVPNGSTLADGTFTAWVSAVNTVTIRFANNNLTLALDPASGSFKVKVFKD